MNVINPTTSESILPYLLSQYILILTGNINHIKPFTPNLSINPLYIFNFTHILHPLPLTSFRIDRVNNRKIEIYDINYNNLLHIKYSV